FGFILFSSLNDRMTWCTRAVDSCWLSVINLLRRLLVVSMKPDGFSACVCIYVCIYVYVWFYVSVDMCFSEWVWICVSVSGCVCVEVCLSEWVCKCGCEQVGTSSAGCVARMPKECRCVCVSERENVRYLFS